MAAEYIVGIAGKPILADRAKQTYGGVDIDTTLEAICDTIEDYDEDTSRMTQKDLNAIMGIFA